MKKTYQYILFDLDGTLTDPKEGITKSVQYALHDFGIEEPDLDKLEKFIGPPLRVSFPEFYEFSEEQTATAIKKFRERYNATGVFENQIYDGMAELLAECKEDGIILAIASSKPQYLVERVLEHFDIKKYFDVIVGCLDEGKRDTKIEVMEEALRLLFPDRSLVGEDVRDMSVAEFDREKVLMVGDRSFDIEGAKHFGVDSLGVTYGYAPEGELQNAGADYLASCIAQMRHIMLGRWQTKKQIFKPSIEKSLEILTPLVCYWFITSLVTMIARTVIEVLMSDPERAQIISVIKTYSNQIAVWINAVSIVLTYPAMLYFYRKSRVLDISPIIKRRNDKRIRTQGAGIFVWAACAAIGLNLLMGYLHIFNTSETYSEVSNIQYSVSMPIGVFIFGILTPIGEELIFRGVIYNRLKKYFSPLLAIVVSALIFGVYHGNLVQLIYATIMGICMALLYESYERILAPVLFHCGANAFIYVVTKNAAVSTMLSNVYVMVLCLAIMLCGCWWLATKQCLCFRKMKN